MICVQVQKLQKVLQPFILRRMKEDVDKTIPLKEETVVEVELTSVQKAYYRYYPIWLLLLLSFLLLFLLLLAYITCY